MPIAHDQTQQSAVTASDLLTWQHTCTGSDRILIVAVARRADGLVYGITYHGVPLTKIRSETVTNPAIMTVELWRLVNPDTGGAWDIVVDWVAAGSGHDASNHHVGASVSFTGVDQSYPIDAQNGEVGSSSGATTSIDVLTVADNAWVIDALAHFGNNVTANSPSTSRSDRDSIGPGSDCFGVSTYGPKTPAGTVSMGWNTDDNGYTHIAVSLKPAVLGLKKRSLLTIF